ncbi:UDP-glycosyltransferase 86a1 [Phtheirospermum japonicum]|uniref:Glycosyltransferase n=1 Tax=Phtheirospermum japonicum TaxID=374723 RepID=A0A830BBZ8_9LAMI|nr:UDP-glycosyltransferase 86a1 [Phtheirospermum japonicum]
MADPKPHAIMFPFPYQGHLTPMINLSIRLASKGITITFVNTEFIHHSISKASAADNVDFFGQEGLDIRYTTISDGFPVEFDRDLNYDLFWETMFRDFPTRVDEIVARTIGAASDDQERFSFFLIADTFFSWPATIAKKYKLVSVSLWTEPAIVFSINYHMDLLKHNGHFPCSVDDEDAIIDYIPGVRTISRRNLMTYLRDPDMIPMLLQVVSKGFDQVKEADFILSNTVEELEFETLSAQSRKHPTYAIGPINFYTNVSTFRRSLLPESDCTNWLNSKPPGSVLYVSFGSIAQTSKQENAELAHGLLLSRVYFVWIVRPDQLMEENGSDTSLPEGFLDSIKEQGLILPWCNQKRLLSDPAIGGFLTHCGWNSIVESIWYGVPMICHPFLVDQPTNRKLVIDDWKVGITLCEGEQIVTRKEVANKINVLMSEERSNEMSQEMKKVSRKFHDSLDSGGSSERNFNQFVEDLKDKIKYT